MKFVRCVLTWLLVLIALGSFSAGAVARTKRTAFVDVTVVPMDNERLVEHQTVLVEAGRIAKIGPADTVKLPVGTVIIDGRNHFLIPGLVDAHVHFFGPGVAPDDQEMQKRILAMLLANGVTTAINMMGSLEMLRLRERVARGELVGPRIYTTGPFFEMNHAYTLGPAIHFPTIQTAEQARSEVIAEKRLGYDFLKVHGDLPAETYQALLDTAKEQGIRVVGHVPSNLGIAAALNGHQALIVHSEEYVYSYFEFHRKLPTDPAEIDAMVKEISQQTKEAGTWVSPTLFVFHQIISQVADLNGVLARPEIRYLPPRVTAGWGPENNPYAKRWPLEKIRDFREQFAIMQRLVRGLRDAGVPLLAGTDPLVPSVVPGFAMKDELQELVAAGLTPYEALQAATANPARFLNASADFGTVAVGRKADLVLLNANPFDDVSHIFLREGVMLGGQWFPEAQLQAELARMAASDRGPSY